MKSHLKCFLCLAVFAAYANIAAAATVALYTASADPGASLDGNGNTVNVWTVAAVNGGSFLDGNSMWTIFDNAASSPGTTATHAFAGGSLTAGQSVSIDYTHNTNIATNQRIGIRLLDASNVVQIELSFLGGGGNVNGFGAYDTGTNTTEIPTGKSYDNSDVFTVTFNIGSGGAYSSIATEGAVTGGGIGSWSGSVLQPLAKIQVFTYGGGSSDQYFNNLSITPEPNSLSLLLCGSLGMGLVRRRRTSAQNPEC